MTDSGTFDEPLDAVQARSGNRVNYLAGVMLKVDITVVSAATSDAIAQAQWADILHNLNIYDALNRPWFDQPMNAAPLKELERYLLRRGEYEPAALAADSDATNVRTFYVYVPLRLPFLADPNAHIQPSATALRRITGTWAASGEWGTGQNITESSTVLSVYAVHMPMHGLFSRPWLKYGGFTPSTFTQGRVPIHGRLVSLIAADPAAGATASIGTTDFTLIEMQGGEDDALTTRPEDIDALAEAYNVSLAGEGDAGSADLALPTAAAVRSFPMYFHAPGAKLSELPFCREPKVTLTVGAGAPAVTDQVYAYAVSRARSDQEFAQAIGQSKDFDGTPDVITKAIAAVPGVEGRNGMIRLDHPVSPWLPRRVSQGAVRNA